MGSLLLLVAKLKWAVAFGALVGAAVSLNQLLLPGSGAYQVKAPVDTAAGLYPGSDVEIAGAKAGRVESITLKDGLALVAISLDPMHAPLHRDARIELRPKSLLGEMYVSVDPGQSPAVFDSGATVPSGQVHRSVQLEEVINTFDEPTRQKLQVLIDNLGGGVAGRGQETNQGFAYGTKDMDDLAAISSTLAERDQDLETVITQLDSVTTELARSDRSRQLGDFIQNTDRLLANLNAQDAQLKRALAETNAALGRSGNALDGTGANLGSIFHQLPYTVHEANVLTQDLGVGMDTLMPHLGQLLDGISAGPQVFGGHDANGYATRVNIVAGPATAGVDLPALAPGSQPAGNSPGGRSANPGNDLSASGPETLPGAVQFLLRQGTGGQ